MGLSSGVGAMMGATIMVLLVSPGVSIIPSNWLPPNFWENRPIGTPFQIKHWPEYYDRYNTSFFRTTPGYLHSGYFSFPQYKTRSTPIVRDAHCSPRWDGRVHLIDDRVEYKLKYSWPDRSESINCVWAFRATRPSMLIRFKCRSLNLEIYERNNGLCRIGFQNENNLRFTDPRLTEVMCTDATWAEYVTREGYVNISMNTYGSSNWYQYQAPRLDCKVSAIGPCMCGRTTGGPFEPILHPGENFIFAVAGHTHLYGDSRKRNVDNDFKPTTRVKRQGQIYKTIADGYPFPWIARVFKSLTQTCTATILTKDWLVTTAECAVYLQLSKVFHVYVNSGASYKGYQGIPHEHYNSEEGINNIGLIQMLEPILFPDYMVSPICITQGYFDTWGRMGTTAVKPETDSPYNSAFERASVIMGHPPCVRHFHNRGIRVRSYNLCLDIYPTMKCGINDGAPLMLKDKGIWYLVGVGTRSEIFCSKNKDTPKKHVYTDFQAFHRWVKSYIKVYGGYTCLEDEPKKLGRRAL